MSRGSPLGNERTEGSKGGGALSIDGRKLPRYRLLRRPVKGNAMIVFFPTHISACYLNRSCSCFFFSVHTHFQCSGISELLPSSVAVLFSHQAIISLLGPLSSHRHSLSLAISSHSIRDPEGRTDRGLDDRNAAAASATSAADEASKRGRGGLRGPPSITFARVRVGGRLPSENFEEKSR